MRIEIEVPKELEERMEKMSHVDWGKELRRLLEMRLKAVEKLSVISEVWGRAKGRCVKTDSVGLIRADRDAR